MNIMTPERNLSAEAVAKRYQRERAARQEAERLLEQKALELYEANKALKAEAAENAAIAEQLQALREAGIDTLFVPTFMRPLPEMRADLDRLMTEIAPAFR